MIKKKLTNHTKENHQYNVTWKKNNNKHILQTNKEYTYMIEERNERKIGWRKKEGKIYSRFLPTNQMQL